MKAEVQTYGGEPHPGSDVRTTQHWVLRVEGEWIADAAEPWRADLFRRIAAALNDAE